MTELRNARHLSVHDLRRRINEGDVDTVVVAFTDVQGRLQGKRVHATYFAEHVLDQGTAGPAYLLGGRRRHERRRPPRTLSAETRGMAR